MHFAHLACPVLLACPEPLARLIRFVHLTCPVSFACLIRFVHLACPVSLACLIRFVYLAWPVSPACPVWLAHLICLICPTGYNPASPTGSSPVQSCLPGCRQVDVRLPLLSYLPGCWQAPSEHHGDGRQVSCTATTVTTTASYPLYGFSRQRHQAVHTISAITPHQVALFCRYILFYCPARCLHNT